MSKRKGDTALGLSGNYWPIPILLSIFAIGFTLYASIERQNKLTELRLQIPLLAKEVKGIQDENISLQYEIKQFESPLHLMELSRKPEFSHLKYPLNEHLIILQEE